MPRTYVPRPRPTSCAGCGEPLLQPAKGRRLRCLPCAQEQDRIRNRTKPPFAPTQCNRCGTPMDGGRSNLRKWCSRCRATVHNENWKRAHPDWKPKPREPRIGTNCSIRYAACQFCHRLLVRRLRSDGVSCNESACQRQQRRFRQLWYERRTHATSIRYWRVAHTKEAQDLAETFFHLRQELRNRSGKVKSKQVIG